MNATAEDFRRHFQMLSDEVLLSTRREDLVETAQHCLDEEIARRGLNPPVNPDEDGAEIAPPPLDPADQLVPLDIPMQPEEFGLARGLLRSAGIPCMVANEHVGLGSFNLELRVPASMIEHAVAVLGFGISDEELAAQAEAAGFFEDEETEDSGETQ